jgi:hypothetical protein
MDVHMARSGKTFAKVDETRSIHKKDMAFETCWHLSPELGRGYLIKACLKPDLVLYVMDYDPNNAFRMAINAVPPGFGFKFFLSGAYGVGEMVLDIGRKV